MSRIPMASEADTSARPRGRIDLLDAARGGALLAMLVYHFTWDLGFFGYLPPDMVFEGGWRLFARCIATTFLFLVGIGLVLAHGRAFRIRPFLVRLAQIAAGAAAVSVATYIFTPDSFVFFGILHQIALASVLGLAVLRLPTPLVVLAGLAVIALPQILEGPAMDARWLAWIGFAANEPLSNDLVPVFPWTGIVFLGIAAGRFATRRHVWERLRPTRLRRAPGLWLTLIGRHSLACYLLHQPISIALVAAFAYLAPPDRAALFPGECRAACVATGAGEETCLRYCGCMQTRLAERDLLDDVMRGRLTAVDQSTVDDTVAACSIEATD